MGAFFYLWALGNYINCLYGSAGPLRNTFVLLDLVMCLMQFVFTFLVVFFIVGSCNNYEDGYVMTVIEM